jgi:hypothetical protein
MKNKIYQADFLQPDEGIHNPTSVQAILSQFLKKLNQK